MSWTKVSSALLAGSAISLVGAGAANDATAAIAKAERFDAPGEPLILTRELRRAVGRDKEIISRRSYRITFVREGEGWRVDGELVGTEVVAPAALSALVGLEKARRDEGLFPLRLSASGLIVEQRGARDPAASAVARDLVSGAVEKISMGPADKALANGMVGQISTQANASGGHWPPDLFRPVKANHTEVRDIPLQDGRKGKVTVTLLANPSRTGLLDHFERHVQTELDGTLRHSRETWTLRHQP